MRKMICVLGFLLLVATSSLAQSTPKVEVSGGYSFQHANPGGIQGADPSGWDASLNWNFTKWLGVKGEFSGYYCCASQKEHNFLFGPQITLRHERHDVFFHGLVGGSHGSGTNFPTDTVTAWDLGAGLDLHLFHADRFALRVAQVDYFATRYAGTTQNNFRYSAGVVIRLGSK